MLVRYQYFLHGSSVMLLLIAGRLDVNGLTEDRAFTAEDFGSGSVASIE